MSEPTWISDLVAGCLAGSQSEGAAIRAAIAKTIDRCAAVADGGRQYAPIDIVGSAIRSLATTNDPWFDGDDDSDASAGGK